MINCPECNSPFSPTQIERLTQGKSVICEICGYEHSVLFQDFKDMAPTRGMEPNNLFRPGDLFSNRPSFFNHNKDNRPKRYGSVPFQQPSTQSPNNLPDVDNQERIGPSVDEMKLLKIITFDWINIKDLAKELGITNRKEFYLLRVQLNEMQKRNLIQIDNQVNKVLIRRLHTH